MEDSPKYGPGPIGETIDQMVRELAGGSWDPPLSGVLGIANGGVPFAHCLAQAWKKITGRELPVGVLDVVFTRDDVATAPIPKSTHPTEIPFSLENTTVLLADDVLFSGRTTRAALDELFSHGRPARVYYVVLFDRGGRRLPIQADLAGFREEVPADQKVRVQLSPENPSANAIHLFPSADS